MVKESQSLKDFKAYISTIGLKTVRVWENKIGLYAQISGWTKLN